MPRKYVRCAVKDCPSITELDNREKRMFCFPKQSDIFRKWVDFCCNDEVAAKADSVRRVCALHFPRSCFTNPLLLKLNRGSIPSLNPPTIHCQIPKKQPTTLKLKYSCKFPGCTSKYYVDTASNKKLGDKNFFLFPSDCKKEQLKQWKRVCLIDDAISCHSFRVCEDHFLEKDFVDSRRERLNNEVVPKNIQLAVYHFVQRESEREESADIIVKELNETVRLAPEVEIQDVPFEDCPDDPFEDSQVDPFEDCQDEIPMETYESLQDVPQCNTLRIISQSDQDPCHIIEELSEMYLHITLPYLEKANLDLQWVYKILSREEGCEKIVYECPNKDDKNGFLLIRDSKWDGINLDKLHLIAIAYRPGIMSLRDLGIKHLSLLQNISFTGKDVIKKNYKVVGTRLRVFLQYPPSFYHLHVHFTAMNDDICRPHFGTAHPLDSVIQNIQMVPTYYQVARLSMCLKESDELFKKFEAEGVVERILPSC